MIPRRGRRTPAADIAPEAFRLVSAKAATPATDKPDRRAALMARARRWLVRRRVREAIAVPAAVLACGIVIGLLAAVTLVALLAARKAD